MSHLKRFSKDFLIRKVEWLPLMMSLRSVLWIRLNPFLYFETSAAAAWPATWSACVIARCSRAPWPHTMAAYRGRVPWPRTMAAYHGRVL